MKLNMFLDVALEEDDVVAIGTEGGSGFTYIGKAGDRELITKAFINASNFPRTNVLDREIVKAYRKEVDDCVAIIIKGTETSMVWTKEEFDKKYKKMLVH